MPGIRPPILSGLRAEGLAEAASDLRSWLLDEALGVWWTLGADHDRGGFFEALDIDAAPLGLPRRARVNGRQTYVFASARWLEWQGPWRQAVLHGLKSARTDYLRKDGLYRTLVGADGAVIDDRAMLYDQAFFLLGGAAAQRAIDGLALESEALALLDRLETWRNPNGGFLENGSERHLSNPHMHLLEAAMAWAEAGDSPRWPRLANELVSLALRKMIDQDTGAIGEVYTAEWLPAPGPAGRRLEPGHQFEWAWLLVRWGRAQRGPDAHRAFTAARGLYRIGLHGVDDKRGVAVNALLDDLSVLDDEARLWPQTEWLKAAVALSRLAEDGDEQYRGDALRAARAIGRYLQTPCAGTWWDRLAPDGMFTSEPSPASSLYHLAAAIAELQLCAEAPTGVRRAAGPLSESSPTK